MFLPDTPTYTWKYQTPYLFSLYSTPLLPASCVSTRINPSPPPPPLQLWGEQIHKNKTMSYTPLNPMLCPPPFLTRLFDV